MQVAIRHQSPAGKTSDDGSQAAGSRRDALTPHSPQVLDASPYGVWIRVI